MRKRMMAPATGVQPSSEAWLDLEDIAEVELTSEDPEHPIEHALSGTSEAGWRAAGPGPQTIRLIFPTPRDITRIQLEFREAGVERTQEFTLRWSQRSPADSLTEIVRQQWNFSPAGSTSQTEEFTVDLQAVATLELGISPDISGGSAPATLTRLRLA